MPPPAVATPIVLRDPGHLWIAPVGSTLPSNTVTGGVFTDSWDAAWLALGATEDGSEFSFETTVEPITVAELFDVIQYVTTGREGSIAFNLANFGASNYRRAMNGGVTALAPTSGTGATALYDVEPTDPGSETKCMIGWESLDATVRLVARQCMQGGVVASAFRKAPSIAVIPCQFNLEKPTSAKPFKLSFAGSGRA